MGLDRSGALARVAVLAASLATGCSSPPEETPPPCADGEHLVGSACVPDVFDQAVIPPRRSASDVDKAADGTLYLRGELLLFLHDDTLSVADATALVGRYGGHVLGAVPFGAMVLAKFDGVTGEAALEMKRAALAADPAVALAVRNALFPPTALSGGMRPANDFENLAAGQSYADFYSEAPSTLPADFRWPFDRIGATAAWSAIYDANVPLTPVVIAVVDGFVEHAGVFDSLGFANAYDFRLLAAYTGDTFNPKHGTSAAAIIGAPNDGTGTSGLVAGVSRPGGGSCVPYDLAPMAVSAKWDTGAGVTNDAIFFSFIRAVKDGARVVNVSMGVDFSKIEAERAAMARSIRLVCARAKSVLFVISAGNDGIDAARIWPASAARADEPTKPPPNIISVAAVGKDDHQAVWSVAPPSASNFDAGLTGAVTLAAPGSDVVSQLPSGSLTLFLGTSAAAPMVAGSAALLFAINPQLTGSGARDVLLAGSSSSAVFPGGIPKAPRLDIAKSVGVALDQVSDNFGKGTCRQDAPPPNVCRVLLDPNTGDRFNHGILFDYDIHIAGTSGMVAVKATGHLRLWEACGPAATVGGGYDVSFDGTQMSGTLGGARCKTFGIDGSSTCPMADFDFAPGATYSLTTVGQPECTVRCPADPMDTFGVDNPVTSGKLTVTFSSDCRSLKGSWQASAGCGYDVTFTGTFNNVQ